MRLPLGFGFALLLMLQSHQQVSTETPDGLQGLENNTPSHDGDNMAGTESGDDSNSTSEDSAVIPVTSNELDANDTDSITSSPPLLFIPFNNSNVLPDTNETSTQNTNTSSPATPGPDITTPMANETTLNSTVTPHPEDNSTKPDSGSFSNETTLGYQNSTTSDSENFTTTHPPQFANTTIGSNSSTNETFPTTTITSATTVFTTDQLSTTVVTNLNRTAGIFEARGNSEPGAASDIKEKARNQAWGAIVGTGVAVGFVALVVYVIMKRRSYRDFSHRKLVEDMPPDPVLRLDNNEPLDLKYDGSAYYNPGLQGDNIQMTNFPRGHSN